MYVDRYDQIMGWLAAIIGLAGEGLLIWLIDQLPLWAQVVVYGVPGLAILVGFFLIGRDAVRARRRRRLKDRSPAPAPRSPAPAPRSPAPAPRSPPPYPPPPRGGSNDSAASRSARPTSSIRPRRTRPSTSA
jgi:hypothetical protein